MSNKYTLHIREGATITNLSDILNFGTGRDYVIKTYSDRDLRTINDFINIYTPNRLFNPDETFKKNGSYITKRTSYVSSLWGLYEPN